MTLITGRLTVYTFNVPPADMSKHQKANIIATNELCPLQYLSHPGLVFKHMYLIYKYMDLQIDDQNIYFL